LGLKVNQRGAPGDTLRAPRDGIETRERRNAPPKTLVSGGAVRDGRCKNKFAGLYMRAGIALNDFMSLGELVVIALGSLLLVVGGIRLARNFFSEEAKRERRRRRNNAPISSRSNRPTVKFSVKTRKDRRK